MKKISAIRIVDIIMTLVGHRMMRINHQEEQLNANLNLVDQF